MHTNIMYTGIPMLFAALRSRIAGNEKNCTNYLTTLKIKLNWVVLWEKSRSEFGEKVTICIESLTKRTHTHVFYILNIHTNIYLSFFLMYMYSKNAFQIFWAYMQCRFNMDDKQCTLKWHATFCIASGQNRMFCIGLHWLR